MKLLAIDGNSIVNRAFYGIRTLTNREGFPTNAIYGFLMIMQRMIDEVAPDAVAVAFDLKEKTFRHKKYDGYKAHRKAMPEELSVQIPKLKEVLRAMNVPCFELPGWEADDLLGSMARMSEETGYRTVIATGDKDALQLINEKTHVYLVTSRMGKTTTKEMDEDRFQEEYGFLPKGIVELKALMGDSSDNIPGVKGVGEKTATSLVQAYQTVEHIYANLDEIEIKDSVRKKLKDDKESALMSHELATICTDAPFDFEPSQMLRKPVNQSALYQLFLELDFHKMIEQMGLHAPQGDKPATETLEQSEIETVEVTDKETLEKITSDWKAAQFVSVIILPQMNGVAVKCENMVAVLLENQLEGFANALKVLFSDEVNKIAHDAKEMMHILLEQGLQTEGFLFDTAVAAYLLAPTDGSYALERVFSTYFPQDSSENTAKVDYTKEAIFSPLSIQRDEAMSAISKDCMKIEKLYFLLKERLEALSMMSLYETVELPLCAVLANMEHVGFRIDKEALKTYGVGLKEKIEELTSLIYDLAGEKFNLNSTQQLGVILFEKLQMPVIKKTKTGYSTSVEVLERLQGMHPIIDAMMEYRKLTKLNSTYVEGLAKVIAEDGRIHTSFQNMVTATGRLSSTEPNLQNIPVRTAQGAKIRTMFVASEGNVLVDADYSQIELRLLAHIAKDEDMIRAFNEGQDIHKTTAAQVFSVSLDEVTDQMRYQAKAVNFGIVYGISEFSLAQDIGVTRKEAGAYMKKYFEVYHGVREYMNDVVVKAKQDGYVKTEMGRRRWLPELKSSNHNLRAFGERVALNMPIQGLGADLMKLAMIRVYDRLRVEGLKAKLVLQVHDELIVDAPIEEAEIVRKLLTEEMQAVAKLSVPLLSEANVGQNWGEAKG